MAEGLDEQAGEAAAVPQARLRTFTSLRHRNYRFLWLSTLSASSGQWIQTISLGWLVLVLTGSPLLVATVGGMRSLPFVFVGPMGGVAADRMDRRRLLMGSSLFIALVALGFAFLVRSGQVEWWHALVFALVSGSGWAFAQPVRQALLADSVPHRDLPNAVALQSLAFNITNIIGPVVGGILIATIGIAGNFFIQSGAFFGVLMMVTPCRFSPPRPLAATTSVWQNLAEGVGYVRRNQVLLALVLLAVVPPLSIMPLIQLLPVFAADVLDVGSTGFGVLLSAFGAGALLGTLTLATLGNFRRKGPYLMVVALLVGTAMVAFSRSPWFGLSLGVLIIVGFLHMSFRILNQTLVQLNTSDAVRGRVMSIYFIVQGLMVVGAVLVGLLAESVGAPNAATITGGLAVAAVLALYLRFRVLGRLQQ